MGRVEEAGRVVGLHISSARGDGQGEERVSSVSQQGSGEGRACAMEETT